MEMPLQPLIPIWGVGPWGISAGDWTVELKERRVPQQLARRMHGCPTARNPSLPISRKCATRHEPRIVQPPRIAKREPALLVRQQGDQGSACAQKDETGYRDTAPPTWIRAFP